MKNLCKVLIPLIIMSFFVTGCPKKKPDPSQTVMSQGSGEGAIGGDMDLDSNYDPDRNGAAGEGLQDRNSGGDFSRQVRGQLQSVYFAFDQSHIRPSERAKAQAAASYLQSNPNKGILIEGYCDWRGTTEYNLGLGDRRASSVRSYLESLGINPSRVQVVSKGDLEAVVNGSSQQMAEDRRAELVVLE